MTLPFWRTVTVALLRDAAHFRRVTAQAGGQHIVIGLQGNPTQANGVKHLRGGERFTGINTGTQGADIPL